MLHSTSSILCRLGATYHEESRLLLRRSCGGGLSNFLRHDAGDFRFNLDFDVDVLEYFDDADDADDADEDG